MAKTQQVAQEQTEQTSPAQPAPELNDATVHAALADETPNTVPAVSLEPPPPPAGNGIVSEAKQADFAQQDQTRDQFIKMLEQRRNVQEPAYTPPPMSERQLSRRELEMKRGAEVVARNAALIKAPNKIIPATAVQVDAQNRPLNLPRRPMNPIKEGTTTQVFRPQDYTHESQHGARNIREG